MEEDLDWNLAETENEGERTEKDEGTPKGANVCTENICKDWKPNSLIWTFSWMNSRK